MMTTHSHKGSQQIHQNNLCYGAVSDPTSVLETRYHVFICACTSPNDPLCEDDITYVCSSASELATTSCSIACHAYHESPVSNKLEAASVAEYEGIPTASQQEKHCCTATTQNESQVSFAPPPLELASRERFPIAAKIWSISWGFYAAKWSFDTERTSYHMQSMPYSPHSLFPNIVSTSSSQCRVCRAGRPNSTPSSKAARCRLVTGDTRLGNNLGPTTTVGWESTVDKQRWLVESSSSHAEGVLKTTREDMRARNESTIHVWCYSTNI